MARDFPPRSGGVTVDPNSLERWLDKVGDRQNIDLLNALALPDVADELGIFDVSASKYLKITLANLFTAISTLGAIAVTGLLTLTSGQIKFPATQNASSDPNTLDDYEEGTFTPVLSFGGASVGIAYTTQLGGYVKIGILVAITVRIFLSSKGSSTGAAVVSGLPFVGENVVGQVQTLAASGNVFAASISNIITSVAQAGNTAALSNVAAGSGAAMVDTDFNATSRFNFGGSYRASA